MLVQVKIVYTSIFLIAAGVNVAIFLLPFFWVPRVEVEISPQNIVAESGYAYITSVNAHFPFEFATDDLSNQQAASLALTENGIPIGPAHSLHADIRNKGRGRYSYWNGSFIFSTSDDSDPRTNGRQYIASGNLQLRQAVWVCVALGNFALAILFRRQLAGLLRRRSLLATAARTAGTAPVACDLVEFAISQRSEAVTKTPVLTATYFRSVALLFSLSLTVLAGLFSTVHNRELGSVQEYRTKTGLDRFDETVRLWIDGGFLRHGGMFFLPHKQALEFYPEQLPPASEIPADLLLAYRNGTVVYLIPAYWMELAYSAIAGGFSTRLMLFYNQFLMALVGVAIGALALRLCSRLGLGALHSFALAAACLVSFQTFGPVLYSFWEVSILSVTLLFGLILLIYDFDKWECPYTAKEKVIRCLIAFIVALGEPATGVLFLLSYLMLRALTSKRGVSTSDVLILFIIPLVLVFGYVQGQHLLLRRYNTSVIFLGSSLLSRSGLDGSTQWYRDHWDLLLRGHVVGKPFGPLAEWTALMLAGACGTIYLLSRYVADPPVREPVRILLSTAGFYFPFAFVFSQGAYIHPYIYDVSLVIPCILSAFCMLPAYLETEIGAEGIAILCAVVGAAGYALVQLRTYVVAFPLPS